jgi:hypothetical protein
LKSISSYAQLETYGRERLSTSFFMRDFLFSEIAAWNAMRNVPDFPDRAVESGRKLCTELLEPLQATFGKIHIRSGYRSPLVNQFGNEHGLSCASNESNYAAHIWDYPDADGRFGATACIVIPWLVDHIARGGSWTQMAWWIHDHLPYSSMYFFPKLAAFNLNWHEVPERRIDSYAEPKGCLTRPGMPNHPGRHTTCYAGFPELQSSAVGSALPAEDTPTTTMRNTVAPPTATMRPSSRDDVRAGSADRGAAASEKSRTRS